MNLGSFVMEKFSLVDAPNIKRLVKDVANIYVSSFAGIDAIVDERNAANKSDKVLPPVFPHQMAALSHSEFCTVFRTHQERLVATGWIATCIDLMEQEHQYLVQYIAAEMALHADLSSRNNNISFDAGWSDVKGRFESLKRFVGGIESILPGTAQLESDFSIVKIEKDNFQSSLTKLSLEEILHSK